MRANTRRSAWIALGLLAALVAWCGRPSTVVAVDIHDTGKYVIDDAGVIDPATRQKMEELLAKLQRATTDQIKVLTVKSLEGEDIFNFSQRHYESWKLGTKAKNNGALIVFALADHKVRVHTGYGLEGALPDQWIGTLSRRIAGQYFRAGRYSEGLYQLTVAVVRKVADDRGVKLEGLPAQPAPRGVDGWQIFFFIIILLFLIWLAYRNNRTTSRYARGPRSVPWIISTGNWGSGGSFGGGFGGGGGSFGGGGGSFGGGGSSGGGGGGASW
jgi:uncharacterized protein